ncbi:type I-E CRISPR-associated protein Cas5/CasD [Nocardioides immobilis]|uniref:Type I-E CRISPR-associated protein Cas5/CasD n=1 Tax=Nocardioides immobilis TaxID=2049295 RepID=A0A417XZL3_9ACTN|nr:type I-E CRISPR-associated protein Cas5/CasD [Nocardioides immobilis]RHW25830.1 type I-E CRISPR-associated protein Cas5/CasD [Nocardioides immobilis]
MTVLLLRLAGPLQSWGDASRFTQRHTRTEPTKSGVLGLLAAAQGRRRADPIEDLAALSFGVRVDQRGRIERDFHTAIRRKDGKEESMPLSYRYYLTDAVFVAGVAGDEALLRGLDEALREPRFPLYLGRRSCPPAGEIALGVHDGELEDILRSAPWEARPWYRREQGQMVLLDLVLDAEPGTPYAETTRDVPLSFDPTMRQYGWRDVVRLAPVEMPNDMGRAEPDFLAAYGGA